MCPRILIPLMVLVLACVSPAAHAGGSCSTHTQHHHDHANAPHVHTPTHAHPRHIHHDATPQLCDDEARDNCCAHHHHEHEHTLALLSPRATELPPVPAPISIVIPDTLRLPTRVAPRWAPLRQRPPDHLGALRTCVMLN